MIFRIESQRDADMIAQGATLGSVSFSLQALQGRDKLCFDCLLCRPCRAGIITLPVPGLHPGLLDSAPLELRSEICLKAIANIGK